VHKLMNPGNQRTCGTRMGYWAIDAVAILSNFRHVFRTSYLLDLLSLSVNIKCNFYPIHRTVKFQDFGRSEKWPYKQDE